MSANWSGQDYAFVLGGAAGLITVLGTFITSMVGLIRVGRTERKVIAVDAKVDGMLTQRDASNVAAGTIIGRAAGDDASAQRAEGRRQQREISAELQALTPRIDGPVPVADDRTAVAAEKGAAATERIADAAEKKP